MSHQSIGNFTPAPGALSKNNKIGAAGMPFMDSRGNLNVRGQITTDEGSVRDDFSNTNIYNTISGTSVIFTNGSTQVLGVGTVFTDGNIAYGDYVKLSTDTDSCYAKVQSVISDTELQLVASYTGSNGTGTGYRVKFKPIVGTTGASVTTASSKATIASGTGINQRTSISREIDYCPLALRAHASVSQRIANQTGYIGLADDPVNPTRRAWFVIDGTDNTVVKTETSNASGDVETSSTITIPLGAVSSSTLRYRILLTAESCKFYINELLIAEHFTHLPDQYLTMDAFVGFVNGGSAPASNTNIALDMIYVSNFDQLQVIQEAPPIAIGTNIAQIAGSAVVSGGYTGYMGVCAGGGNNWNNCSNYNLISAASTNATNLRNTQGRIHVLVLTNTTASMKYFKIYNKASAPTVGTDTPVWIVGIPPVNTVTIVNEIGLYVANGISFAITGASAIADTTAVAVGDVIVNIIYA